MDEHIDTDSSHISPREIIIRQVTATDETGDFMPTEGDSTKSHDTIDFAKLMPGLEKRESELKERIRSNIYKLNALNVMKSATFYMRMICMHRYSSRSLNNERNLLDELHDNNALLVPEYLQSSLVVLDKPEMAVQITEEDMQKACAELFDDCEKLIVISRPLKMMRAITAVGEIGHEDTAGRFQLESKLYEDLRGKRYQVLEEPYLRYLIGGQDHLIADIYGISGEAVVNGAIALMDSLIKGWQTTLEEISNFVDEFGAIDQDDAEALERLKVDVAESGISERLWECALFNVKKITEWPDTLIDDLTLEAFSGPGKTGIKFEDLDPVETLPIRNKPFIRINGIAYCFCYANYLDNFYRALYAASKSRYERQHPLDANSFRELWNNAQARASENAVADLFKKILPGSVVVSNSYHPLTGTAFNKKHYEESDIVVLYEDVLISVEVKGGSYCPTDPINDPEGHVRSLKTLIEKAATQAQATIDYVRRCSGSTCRLYAKDGGTLYEFNADDIRQFFKICVTIDDINEFATKIEKVGLLDVPEDTIALSIDDLLVYERYFDNPLIFLHYLIQRREATRNPLVKLNDELDHLGYYISVNCYPEHVSRLVAEESGNNERVEIVADGLRDSLNDWFQSLYESTDSTKPVQNSPMAFDKIISALFKESHSNGRRLAACSLLDLGSNTREGIAVSISARISGPKAIPGNSMIEIPAAADDDVAISLFISSVFSACDWTICREKAISAMLTRQEDERIVMLCEWSDANKITSCKIELLKRSNLTEHERSASARFNVGIRTMRKNGATKYVGRKIGRNEPCPCGSGKKFKRCCGR